MNQPAQFPPAAPGPTSTQIASAESNARIIYILYLVSLVVGVTSLVGVVMAYVNRGTAPAGLDTHYRFLIRTFWIGLLYGVVGMILSVVLIGFAVLLFTAVWMIVRCVKGMNLLAQHQPVPNPGTWLW